MGEDFETFRGHDITSTEILVADDTLLFTADGESMNQLLHTVEHVSGLFGLMLNRSKCVVVNLKRICPIVFENVELIKEVARATYLGVATFKDAGSDKEVQKRITKRKMGLVQTSRVLEKRVSLT